MGRPFKCPYCGSSDTTGKGVRKTKTMGVRRIRRCKACRRKFTPKSQPLAAEPGSPSTASVPTLGDEQDELQGAGHPVGGAS